MAHVIALDHFTIHTNRPTETIAFYTDLLGLENRPDDRPAFDFAGAWLWAGDRPVIHLVFLDKDPGTVSGPFDHIAFATDDFDGLCARLVERNVDHKIGGHADLGLKQVFVHDPNGIRVEVGPARVSHDHHQGHDHSHGHEHGHEHDRGIKGMVRYLRFAREMWSSDVNEAVVARLGLKPGETVMDIGAGAGAGTMVAVKAGSTVMAVEPTPYMRRVLGLRRFLGRAQNQIQIVDGAAESTNVESNSIDAAWAVNTMHHWTNMAAGIAELARVLAPGGRILLVDENFDDPAHPDFEKFGARRDEHSHHFETVDPEAVADQLRVAGMTVSFAGFDEIANRPAIIIEARS